MWGHRIIKYKDEIQNPLMSDCTVYVLYITASKPEIYN